MISTYFVLERVDIRRECDQSWDGLVHYKAFVGELQESVAAVAEGEALVVVAVGAGVAVVEFVALESFSYASPSRPR